MDIPAGIPSKIFAIRENNIHTQLYLLSKFEVPSVLLAVQFFFIYFYSIQDVIEDKSFIIFYLSPLYGLLLFKLICTLSRFFYLAIKNEITFYILYPFFEFISDLCNLTGIVLFYFYLNNQLQYILYCLLPIWCGSIVMILGRQLIRYLMRTYTQAHPMYFWLDCYKGWRSRIDTIISFIVLFISPFIMLYLDFQLTIFLYIVVIFNLTLFLLFIFTSISFFVDSIMSLFNLHNVIVPVNFSNGLLKYEKCLMIFIFYLLLTWDIAIILFTTFLMLYEFNLVSSGLKDLGNLIFACQFLQQTLLTVIIHVIMNLMRSELPPINGRSTSRDLNDSYNEGQLIKITSTFYKYLGRNKQVSDSMKFQSVAHEAPTCLLCYDNKSDSVLMPCGHGGLCIGCATNIFKNVDGKKCPICRCEISRVLKIGTSRKSSAGTHVYVDVSNVIKSTDSL